VISGHPFRRFIAYLSYDTQYGIDIAYRLLIKVGYRVIPLILISLGTSGCREQPTPYRPPTIAVHATQPVKAIATPTFATQFIETPLARATPTCTNNLTFMDDISIPDGMIVRPGDRVDKRWLVQNSGSCNWDERYQLKSISTSELNAPVELALFPARSGTKTILRILFTAPADLGNYQNTWQAYDPQGQPFGDPLTLQITVDSGTP
jgi:hypothetical protein